MGSLSVASSDVYLDSSYKSLFMNSKTEVYTNTDLKSEPLTV